MAGADPINRPGQQLLQLRTELFEHGLFPMQSKLSANVLVNTFTNLNLLSSIDYKIKLVNWVEQVKTTHKQPFFIPLFTIVKDRLEGRSVLHSWSIRHHTEEETII